MDFVFRSDNFWGCVHMKVKRVAHTLRSVLDYRHHHLNAQISRALATENKELKLEFNLPEPETCQIFYVLTPQGSGFEVPM